MQQTIANVQLNVRRIVIMHILINKIFGILIDGFHQRFSEDEIFSSLSSSHHAAESKAVSTVSP